ncbi:hypothetical protein PT974_02151 [Cladobotryum mycophilum]|uniref:Heterokaryon incompatibility domain-containing protein n=1 Tax=Cladobotryum mycophilum TaxID=491253 RepID=A0ABR0SXB3_9HYPO
MKLIDCDNACLETCIVDAPAGSPYIALSYVWGSPKSETGNQGTGLASTKWDQASNWPRVIWEAMTVVRELGYRYLWADQLCINQDDPDEQQTQISSMNLIYGGADLTIVAAAGEDSDYGLPGVGYTPRSIQPTLELAKIQIISCLKHPRNSIKCSKWATRAWTHQEALLSQRLLFFTNSEAYFDYVEHLDRCLRFRRLSTVLDLPDLGRLGLGNISCTERELMRSLDCYGDSLREVYLVNMDIVKRDSSWVNLLTAVRDEFTVDTFTLVGCQLRGNDLVESDDGIGSTHANFPSVPR